MEQQQPILQDFVRQGYYRVTDKVRKCEEEDPVSSKDLGIAILIKWYFS